VKKNDYPWNLRASVLYLESPVGVGYSIAGAPDDIKQNDMTQSEDALLAVLEFYKKFPAYSSKAQNNELYVTGESYGGIYVPYLSWQIYEYNQQALFDPTKTNINLAGFIVFNGVTDFTVDVWPSYPATVYNFNIVPEDVYDIVTDPANDCFYSFNDAIPHTNS